MLLRSLVIIRGSTDAAVLAAARCYNKAVVVHLCRSHSQPVVGPGGCGERRALALRKAAAAQRGHSDGGNTDKYEGDAWSPTGTLLLRVEQCGGLLHLASFTVGAIAL